MVVFTGFAGWLFYLTQDSFITGLVFGAVGTALSLLRIHKTLRKLANHKLGLQGEQIVVGGVLDRLSSDTVRVFHDLEIKQPGRKRWNIDHVAATPAGVFVFETKARRKPKLPSEQQATQKNHEVVFDAVHLHFPMGADSHGVRQAARNAGCTMPPCTTAALDLVPIPEPT